MTVFGVFFCLVCTRSIIQGDLKDLLQVYQSALDFAKSLNDEDRREHVLVAKGKLVVELVKLRSKAKENFLYKDGKKIEVVLQKYRNELGASAVVVDCSGLG